MTHGAGRAERDLPVLELIDAGAAALGDRLGVFKPACRVGLSHDTASSGDACARVRMRRVRTYSLLLRLFLLDGQGGGNKGYGSDVVNVTAGHGCNGV
jgi:hypothetical protein